MSCEKHPEKLNGVRDRTAGISFTVLLLACLFCSICPVVSFAGGAFEDSLQISVASEPFADGEQEKYRLTVLHPYAFDPEGMVKAMSSLAYQKRGISWSDKRRVFPSPVVSQLAPLIVKQYAQTNSGQRVVFKLKKASGRIFLEGDTFLTPEGMHWRMTVIQKDRRRVDDFSVTGESWRLVPLTGQSYKTKQRFKDLVEDINNWVVFNHIKPIPGRILPASPADEDKADLKEGPGSDIKSRLKILQDLKQEGLIGEEEYQDKRKEILNDL